MAVRILIRKKRISGKKRYFKNELNAQADLAGAVAVRDGAVNGRVIGFHRLEDRLQCRARAHRRLKRISFDSFRVLSNAYSATGRNPTNRAVAEQSVRRQLAWPNGLHPPV